MCLIPFIGDKNVPFNDSKIRWKFFCINGDGKISSIYTNYQYKKNDWNIAQECDYFMKTREEIFGFHVFITEEDALLFAKEAFSPHYVFLSTFLKKVEVDNFLNAGYNYDITNIRNETWEKLRIIE